MHARTCDVHVPMNVRMGWLTMCDRLHAQKFHPLAMRTAGSSGVAYMTM
jgi:hypothetical protein